MPLARRGDEGIVSQLAALGVEVPHQKQTGALFDRTGKELAVLVPEQILLFLQIPGKLLFGNAQLLGGGADVGAVRRVNKGVVILRFWEGKPETAGQLPVSGVFAAQTVQVLRHGLGVRLQRIQQAVRHIRAVLADGGNDLMGDPALEGSRFRLFGTKDQMIESGFTYCIYFNRLIGVLGVGYFK